MRRRAVRAEGSDWTLSCSTCVINELLWSGGTTLSKKLSTPTCA